MSNYIIKKGKPLEGTFEIPADRWVNWNYLSLAFFSVGETIINKIPPLKIYDEMVTLYEKLGYEIGVEGRNWIIAEQFKKPVLIQEPIEPKHEIILMTIAGIFAGFQCTNHITLNNKYISQSCKNLFLKLFDCQIIEEVSDGDQIKTTVQISRFKLDKAIPKENFFIKIAMVYYYIVTKKNGTLDVTNSGPDHLENILESLSGQIQYEVTNNDDMNELEKRMLKKMGKLEKPSQILKIGENFSLQAMKLSTPGDFSLASIYSLTATLIRGSKIILENIILNPSRIAFFNALKRMGASLSFNKRHEKNGESSGTVTVEFEELTGRKFDYNSLNGIDEELPLLIIAGAFATGKTIIRNISYLRTYDKDYLGLIISSLKSSGVEIGEVEDGLVINGKDSYDGVPVSSHGRPMVGFAHLIFALRCHGETNLKDTGCLNEFHKDTFDTLLSLSQN